MTIVPWTRLQGHPIWAAAMENYTQGLRTYHNEGHICRMYYYAAKMEWPYDEFLDWAILAHDVIYDDLPHKEIRSVEWLYEQFCEFGEPWDHRIYDLIMSTVDHSPATYKDNRLIILDLYELTVPEFRALNYMRVKSEMIYIYDIDEVQFAAGNRKFMLNLAGNFAPDRTNGLGWDEYWDAVAEGCLWCATESEKILLRSVENY